MYQQGCYQHLAYLLVLLATSASTSSSSSRVSSNSTKSTDTSVPEDHASLYSIQGPGLSPDRVILPCRYFFVERDQHPGTKDDEYHNKTKNQQSGKKETDGKRFSKEDLELEVAIEGVGEERRICRAWIEVFPRTEVGGFLVRYKLHQPCNRVRISVLLGGEHVVGSPVLFSRQVLPDSCSCPLASLTAYIESSSCPAPLPQLEEDLSRWSGGVDMREAVRAAEETFRHAGSQCWCHYVVKGGEIYRKCYGQHVGFNMFWDKTLLWLSRRARLPNLELLVNLGDWPLVKPNVKTNLKPNMESNVKPSVKPSLSPIPMFSWCGSASTTDMLFPTYELTESSLECMGRQSLDTLAAMAKNTVPWWQKTEKLFWRGRDSRQERLQLVAMARDQPDLINASITAYFFFRDKEKELGREPYVSFFDFFDHKYQMNIDGTVAAYRLPYLLAGSGVVFKQDSPYYEHFYSSLRPWEHYIPVRGDLADLTDKILWARQHDQQARDISLKARQFARDHLLPHSVLCYHAQLLKRWAGLLKGPVVVEEGMEKVEEKEVRRGGRCGCERGQEEQEQGKERMEQGKERKEREKERKEQGKERKEGKTGNKDEL